MEPLVYQRKTPPLLNQLQATPHHPPIRLTQLPQQDLYQRMHIEMHQIQCLLPTKRIQVTKPGQFQ